MLAIENVDSPGSTYCERSTLSTVACRPLTANVPVGEASATEPICASATRRGASNVPASVAPENVSSASKIGSSNGGASASKSSFPQ